LVYLYSNRGRVIITLEKTPLEEQTGSLMAAVYSNQLQGGGLILEEAGYSFSWLKYICFKETANENISNDTFCIFASCFLHLSMCRACAHLTPQSLRQVSIL